MSIQIGQVKITSETRVEVALGASDDMLVQDGTDVPGARFRPDRAVIKYRDGAVAHCMIAGPNIRADGAPYLSGRRGIRAWDFDLDPKLDAPDWVHLLVDRFRPTRTLA